MIERKRYQHRTASIIALALICVLTFALPVPAQTSEIGLQLTGVHLHKIDEAPIGIGVRFDYNMARPFAIDAEVTHAPQNSSGNFGETTMLLGVRVGRRFGRIGVFGLGRAGVTHFGGEYFRLRLDRKNFFTTDLGGVLEYYPSVRTFIRIDAGDTVIYYGSARLFNRENPDPLGTVHNFQPGFGIGIRF